jgi:hypothetical protein
MYRRRFAIEQPLRPIILEPMFANANRLVTNAIHDLPSSKPYLSEPLLLSAHVERAGLMIEALPASQAHFSIAAIGKPFARSVRGFAR